MDFKLWYKRQAVKYFSNRIEPHLSHFKDIKQDLIKARIDYSLLEYFSLASFSSALAFVFVFILLTAITYLIPSFDILVGVIFSLNMSVFLAALTFFVFYIFPSFEAKERAKKIDYSLPFATTYMATVSGSEAPPTTMFKILSNFNEYPEIALEAGRIVRNIEMLGMTVIEALFQAAKESPSEKFKELVWGISTTLRTGGDLTDFLHEKARAYMRDYRRELNQYSNTLSTFLEVYLTLVIVGSIFFIIITSIISAFGLSEAMGSLVVFSQFAVVFLLLPGISIGFIYLLKGISPES
ncbi:MAG: type II secretion system F family protein [Candidatus Aenigmatarchaeota archaeon]